MTRFLICTKSINMDNTLPWGLQDTTTGQMVLWFREYHYAVKVMRTLNSKYWGLLA